MSFNFHPKQTRDISFESLSESQILVHAIESCKHLNWRIESLNNNGLTAITKISWNSWGEKVLINIDGNKASITSQSIRSQVTDWGRNRKNIDRLLTAIDQSVQTLDAATVEEKTNQIQTSFNPDIPVSADTEVNKKISFISLFIPREGFIITPIIIDINILVFIIMVLSGVPLFNPDSQTLVNWGANYGPVTTTGEWWRLFTSCFIHIGILHLLMNMYALIYIGLLLEPQIGKTRFISAYVLAGIAASATSLWWHHATVSAGASGAIFGMYGVFLAMLTTNLVEKSARNSLLTSIGIFVGYNLLNGLSAGIDNAAHIGGLAGGLVIGYTFIPALKKPWNDDLKLITIGFASIVIISASSYLYSKSTDDMPKYEASMKKFETMQSLALEIYHLPKNTPKETILSEIKEKGLYYWDEISELITHADQLEIPAVFHNRDKKLLEYCDLRRKSYNMLYLYVQTGDKRFGDSLMHYNKEIERSVKELDASN